MLLLPAIQAGRTDLVCETGSLQVEILVRTTMKQINVNEPVQQEASDTKSLHNHRGSSKDWLYQHLLAETNGPCHVALASAS